MSFLGKVYTLVSQENFDGYLKSAGMSDDKIQATLSSKPTTKIEQNGDSYTVTTGGPRGEKVSTFKSGVEFDDTIGDDNIPIKTSYTVSGNTVTQTVKSSIGNATFKREYNGDDLVITVTGDNFNGVAKRFYKA